MSAGRLQRRCACEERHDRQCPACRGRQQDVRRYTDGLSQPGVPRIVHDVLRAPGEPLDSHGRASMERRLGHDFSQVRAHTDGPAAASARAIDAHAYTVGHDIVFAAGRYAPHTTIGIRLLAHELTHVVQQRGVDAQDAERLSIGDPHDRSEHEAEQTAATVAASLDAPVASAIAQTVHAAPVLRRQPAPSSVLDQRASRVLADCDVSGGSKERKCNIDQLSKAIIAALTSSPLAYVSISGRTSPRSKEDPSGEAFGRADIMRQALIQWIGPNKFADARFQAGVIEGAEREPQVEIRIAFRPQVLSDPRTPLPPRPADGPLPFSPPPKKEGAAGVPPPPAGPSRDDPKSPEDRQKDWDSTIVTGPEKTEEQRKADLDKKTSDAFEKAGTTILDAVTNMPAFKNLITEKLDPVVDKLPAAVPLAGVPILAATFIGLRQTRGELPIAKMPPIKVSSGKVLAGLDTRVQFTFRGPVSSPTEISASFTVFRSGHPSKIPEGAELNLTVTAKFPDSSKAVAPDNPAASQSAVFTLTIPLPGDVKAKK
jgi:Domain of unknown function (DUF4157)